MTQKQVRKRKKNTIQAIGGEKTKMAAVQEVLQNAKYVATNIPVKLKQFNQWVVWGVDKNKMKCPYNPKTMKPAKAGDPTTWGSFAEAEKRVLAGQAMGVICTLK